MSSIFIYYGLLSLLTFILAIKATSLKGKDLEKTTVYELTDRISWVLGGFLLAILSFWWKWPLQNILGAILVPLLGIIVAGGTAQLTLGTILEAKSTSELVRKLVSLVIFYLVAFFVIRFILRLFF